MKESQKQSFFKGLPTPERITALRENATEQYNKAVIKNYTDDELTSMKHELSDVSIKINDIEIEKKETVAEISTRLKIEKLKRQTLLRGLKNRFYESLETVFDIADNENGIMETFDANGDLIGSRRLTPAEKQTNITHQIQQQKAS